MSVRRYESDLTRWGVPDWRNADAYPQPQDLTIDEWRWEFTRRRRDYREDWLLTAYLGLEQIKRSAAMVSDTPPPDGLIDTSMVRAPCAHAMETYGLCLRSLINPALPAEAGRGLFMRAEYKVAGFGPRAETPVRFEFDLKKNINKQIEEVHELLTKIAQPQTYTKHYIDRWPLYLRVLDARDAGLSWRKIGEVPLEDALGLAVEDYDRIAEAKPKSRGQRLYRQALGVAHNFSH